MLCRKLSRSFARLNPVRFRCATAHVRLPRYVRDLRKIGFFSSAIIPAHVSLKVSKDERSLAAAAAAAAAAGAAMSEMCESIRSPGLAIRYCGRPWLILRSRLCISEITGACRVPAGTTNYNNFKTVPCDFCTGCAIFRGFRLTVSAAFNRLVFSLCGVASGVQNPRLILQIFSERRIF